MSYNPLKFYRQVLRRLFLLYRHVLGLMVGGLIAYVNDLPAYKRKFFRAAGSRVTALLLRPFVKRRIRNKPFEVQLRLRLEMLGPTYVKLGQIMAIREDILPSNITDELKQLLDQLPPVPYKQIEEIIEKSLERPASELFESVDPNPLGTASIGQTHRAKTLTGDDVVLKIIKPGIRETILYDIRLLQILANILEWIIPRYQPKTIINEFCSYTEKEIDLTFEADHAETFAANFVDHEEVVFPKIYREFTSHDVLCMEFLDGVKPSDPRVLEMSKDDKDKISDLGAFAIIKMLYQDGFFHADLHAGNLFILPGPKVGFIDLGMVGRFDHKIRMNMLYYFNALVSGDVDGAVKYLLAMARVGKGGDPEGFKRAVADLFRRFLLQTGRGDFSLAHLILEALGLGGKYRLFFPVEMTLMIKALVTFEGVGKSLDPNLDVPELSRRHVRRIFANHYNPAQLVSEFMRGVPEMIDTLVRAPELLSSGSRALEELINNSQRQDNPFESLRSSLMAGACIIGGVLGYVQDAHFALWGGLFLSSIIFYFWIK